MTENSAAVCRYCGSDRVASIGWQDLMPMVKNVSEMLIYDGMNPVPRMLTFCEWCERWLQTAAEQKQADEVIAAIRLVAATPELASARIEHADRPDLRLHLHGRVFGLEVTRIARDGQDEIGRAAWRRDVQRAAQLMRRTKGDPPAWVSVRWNSDPPRADVNAVASLLVDVVDRRLARLVDAWTSIGPEELSDDAAKYVHGLFVRRTRADDRWRSGFGNMPDVQPKELQQKIAEKATKAAGYRSQVDRLWLLIYAEASNAAQALDLTDEVRAADYSSPFDRVFFIDCMDMFAELRLR